VKSTEVSLERTMKVALYARVSLDEHSDDKRYQDPENQLQPLREFARIHGYEVVAEYVDRMSGKNPARPELRRMHQDAMLRRFQGIVVWKLDRYSREGVRAVLEYIRKLKSRGIWVMSMTESWMDTRQDNPTAELVLVIMAWAAEEEHRKISERTKAGIARRRAIGQWKGGRPRKEINTTTIITECEPHGKDKENR
jgi:DNA invertase Pin-like site-specific DNA recombinase